MLKKFALLQLDIKEMFHNYYDCIADIMFGNDAPPLPWLLKTGNIQRTLSRK